MGFFNLFGKSNIKETTTATTVIESNIPHHDLFNNDVHGHYTTHKAQVDELIKMHDGQTKYGRELVQQLVALHAAFVMPNGVKTVVDTDEQNKPYEAESVYINKFLKVNNIFDGGAFDLCREAYLQGQLLLKLTWDPVDNVCKIDYIPWNETQYKVTSVSMASSMFGPYVVEWVDKQGIPQKLEDDNLVFVCFNGRLGKLEGQSRLGGVIKVLQSLSKDLIALRNWIELFCFPVPVFSQKDEKQSTLINNLLKDENFRWEQGTAFSLTDGSLTFAGPAGAGAEILIKSILEQKKIISAATNIPIHYIGEGDIPNRATAEELGQSAESVIIAEISQWTRFYQELMDKCIRIRNRNLTVTAPLKEGVIHPQLLSETDRQYSTLKNVIIPGVEKGIYPKRMAWENTPGYSVDDIQRMDEAEKANAPKSPVDSAYLDGADDMPNPFSGGKTGV